MSNPKVKAARKAVTEAVNAEMNRLYRERGELKPSAVVEAAKSRNSPLHSHFEWDDKKCGVEYRLQQARSLIRITVLVEGVGGTERRESFVHVPTAESAKDREGSYHPVSVVVANVDWYARALTELQGKVRSATAAAEELKKAAQASESTDSERLARITLAITALQTAGAAVQALH